MCLFLFKGTFNLQACGYMKEENNSSLNYLRFTPLEAIDLIVYLGETSYIIEVKLLCI